MQAQLFSIRGLVTLTAIILSASVAAHTDEAPQQKVRAELTEQEQAVVAVLDNYAAAYAAADIAAIRALTVADGRFSFIEGTAVDASWADYEAHAAAEMPAFSDAHYEFTNILPYVADRLAYATFNWAMDVVIVSDQFEGGKHPVSMRGVGTAVFEKQGTGWRLRHMQTAREKAAPAR